MQIYHMNHDSTLHTKEPRTNGRWITKIKMSRFYKTTNEQRTDSWIRSRVVEKHWILSNICACTSFTQPDGKQKQDSNSLIHRIEFEYKILNGFGTWLASDSILAIWSSDTWNNKLLRFGLPNRCDYYYYFIHPSKINLVTFECAVQFGSIYD